MAELKIYLRDDLDTRFRKAAMSAFGYGRGSLSKAAVEAISRWCSEREDLKSFEALNAEKNELQPAAQTLSEAAKRGPSRVEGRVSSATSQCSESSVTRF